MTIMTDVELAFIFVYILSEGSMVQNSSEHNGLILDLALSFSIKI